MKHALSGETSAQPEPKAGYQLMRLKMKLLRSKATFKTRRGGIGPVGNSSLSVQILRPSAIFAPSFTELWDKVYSRGLHGLEGCLHSSSSSETRSDILRDLYNLY